MVLKFQSEQELKANLSTDYDNSNGFCCQASVFDKTVLEKLIHRNIIKERYPCLRCQF